MDLCGKLTNAEFLSGLTKYDKIKPVITLVIFWSADEWDAPRSLYDMFDDNAHNLKNFVSDYRLNIIIPYEIKNFDGFSTSLRYVLEFIRNSNDKIALRNMVKKLSPEDIIEIGYDADLVYRIAAGS